MIIWTNEMLENLKNMGLKEFCEQYKMSIPTARNKRKEIESKAKEKISVSLKEVRASKLEIVPSVILDLDKLIKEGYAFYSSNHNNEIKKLENMILDFEHILEADDVSDEDAIKIARSIAECRRVRREYKNEKQFLDANKVDCEHFISFIKNLKSFSNNVEHYIYKPRVLKDIIGEKINVNQKNISEDVIERLLALEKMNIKQSRQIKRSKGELVEIDLLKNNFIDLFKKLDEQTRTSLLLDCEQIYKGVEIDKVKEYVIYNSILPYVLYKNNYFLKGDNN